MSQTLFIHESIDFSKLLNPVVHALASRNACVLLPTETVYGLATAFDSAEGIAKILALKDRPQEKVLPVFVENLIMADRIAFLSTLALELMEKFWPGPLTLVVPAKQSLSCALLSEDSFVGLRSPAHPIAQYLLHGLAKPLVCTSANISGEAPARRAEEAKQLFFDDNRLDYRIIQAEDCVGEVSTVAKIMGSSLEILRQGAVRLLAL